MNNNILEYRPYRVYVYFIIPIMVVVEIFFLVLLGICLADMDTSLICLCIVTAAFAALSFFTTKLLYDQTKVTIFFESEGVRLINDSHNIYGYVSWNNFSNGYYCNNYKGHEFLVLSPTSLPQKQVKKIVNRSACRFQMCIDNVVVIYVNGNKKEVARIKEMITEKIPYIKEM